MHRFLQARLVYILAIAAVLSLPSVLAVAQDATAPTANYTPPPAVPSANVAPGAVHSLGVLNTSDLSGAPMPSAASMPPASSRPLLTAAPASPKSTLTPDDVMQPQQVGSVTYVTGGVGEEERNILQATKKNYNLHVMIADTTGHFVADTQIIIRDHKGGEVLSATAGPIFYAKLPAGSYTVEATNQGQNKKQNVTIHGNEASHAYFSW